MIFGYLDRIFFFLNTVKHLQNHLLYKLSKQQSRPRKSGSDQSFLFSLNLRKICHKLFWLFLLFNSFVRGWYPPHCTAYGFLAPQPGVKVKPPALEARTLNHWASTEVLNFVLLSFAFVQVYNLLPVKDLSSFPSSVNQQEEDNEDCISRDNVYINGIMYSPVSNTNEKDMYSFLQVSPLYC